jgi:hypothetical protein
LACQEQSSDSILNRTNNEIKNEKSEPTRKLLHHHEGKILVADVEHQVWTTLVNSLWHVGVLKGIEDVITVLCKMFID